MVIVHFVEFSVSNGTQCTFELSALSVQEAIFIYCKVRHAFFKPMDKLTEGVYLVKVR